MLGRGGGSASTTLTWAAVTATRSSLAAFLGEPCDRWGAQKKCILASRLPALPGANHSGRDM